MSRVFTNGPGDLGSLPGRVIPKTQKMVLEAALLNTQIYKVRIKSKVEQSRERSSAPSLHLGVVAIEKGAFGLPSTAVANYYGWVTILETICMQANELSFVGDICRCLPPDRTWHKFKSTKAD